MSAPLATYQTGTSRSTFGVISYELHADLVRVREKRKNFECDNSVLLADLRLEPVGRSLFRVHNATTRIFAAMTIGPLSCGLLSWLVFRNYHNDFTYWYTGCATLATLGLVGSIFFRPSPIERVQFQNQAGLPALNIIGSFDNRASLEEFVDAVRTQASSLRSDTALNSTPT